MHARLRVLEVETKMLRQRLDGRFGSVVSRVARRIRNPLLAPRDHDRTRLLALSLALPSLLEIRNIGVQSIDDAVEVRIQDLRKAMVSSRPLLSTNTKKKT
jgi:hypothetical protein